MWRLFGLGLVLSWAVCVGETKVCLLLDKGGKDDKSFNAAAFRGAGDAATKKTFKLQVVEAADDASIDKLLRSLARSQCDMILAIGFVMADPILRVAKDFPKISFVVVDAKVEAPNVRSVVFRDAEGAFLVGYLAGLASQTHSVGFIGGMEVDLIRRFEKAYRKGALVADAKTTIISQYVGSSSDAWRNPTKAKEIALSQYQKGVDIIFAPAGASGTGVFDAAAERQKLVIGVDSNQNWIKPGRVLTSMLKRVDLAVEEAILAKLDGKLTPGIVELGLKEKGIDYAVDVHNEKLIAPFQKQLEQMKQQIIAGKVKV